MPLTSYKNNFLLLFQEEGQIHDLQMAAKEKEAEVHAIEERRKTNWFKNRSMESELNHLNVNKAWE